MPYTNSLGFTLDDETIAAIKDGSFPDLDEIICESMGIWMEENGIDQEDYWVDGEPMDFDYKFVEFDTHAIFDIAFENGKMLTIPVPLFYFTGRSM